MQWLMLQQKEPEDFVIATGRTEKVRRFVELSAKKLGWNKKNDGPSIIWEGNGINEIGRRADNKKIVIKIDPRYFRPTEVDHLLGDPTKARNKLGWVPRVSLEELINEMINNDIEETKKELILKKEGFQISESIDSLA